MLWRKPWLTEIVQVTTLGQPLEVLKTQMAANRQQTMLEAMKTVWSRGGVSGFYQGLIPWVRFLSVRSTLLAVSQSDREGLD